MQFPNLLDNGTLLSLSFILNEFSMERTQGNAGLGIWEIAVTEPAPNKNKKIVNLSSGVLFLLNGLPV